MDGALSDGGEAFPFVLSGVEGWTGRCLTVVRRLWSSSWAWRTVSDGVLALVHECSPFDSAQGERESDGRGCAGEEVWLAKNEIAAQSPRVNASFFARLQPLIRRSAARASSRVATSSENTNARGRREKV